MIKQKIIIFLLMSLLIISCSQGEKKTTAKLKLNLSGITNLNNGIGAGGALLFGKSASGEQFGRLVSAAEQDIEIPNGDWSFYAVMWENANTAGNFKGTVYCGKSANKLTGVALNISMNLSNSICADSDFSNGSHYVETKNKFPNLFIEECDELDKSNSYTCLRDNQGSALSYRMSFKSYVKNPAGALLYTGEVSHSACRTITGPMGMYNSGTELNFPTSRSAMPFAISVEMFLGSNDCGLSVPETKGVFTHNFVNGIAADSSPVNKMTISPSSKCSFGPGNEASCKNIFGTWSGSTCSVGDNIISLFVPVAECVGGGSVISTKSLKQMVSVPKDYLCRNTNLNLRGTNVFPGGDGSIYRPFKICSEWQLNQIGEAYASSSIFSSSSFKLMNDLDMNNTDFVVAARPVCAGLAGSIYKKHHNLNPIGQVSLGACTAASTPNEYSGEFNGNFKTISHGRINVAASEVGFVRRLGTNGVIKNLFFKKLEVEGISNVGGIVGNMTGSNGVISNIRISDGDVEGDSEFVGGIAGTVLSGNKIFDVQVKDMSIYGSNKVGGLVGINDGAIEKSMFKGRINHHAVVDGSVGGLVGQATTGSSISSSFSEGAIESYAKWTGGITGINEGSINNSYSNAYIISKYSDPAAYAYIGGISGGNVSGSITNVYTDSVLNYEGMGGMGFFKDAIVASPGGITPSSCYSSLNNVSASGCIFQSDLRTGTISAFQNSTWKANIVGALPRLIWEWVPNSRSCLSPDNFAAVSTQVGSGRGTFLLPVIICTPAQLASLAGTPANRFIKLGEDINLSSWTAAELISTFTGVLDGQGHSLFGLTIDTSISGNIGIFKNNTGSLINIKLLGNSFTHNNTGATGVLAGVNSGIIKNIFLTGNSIQADSYAGLVVGSNSVGGQIVDVYAKDGKIDAESYVGGVAGSNEGNILRVSVNTNIKEKTGSVSYFKFGGITGYNGISGVIEQSVFSGNMYFNGVVSNATPTYIGGLVGYNSGVVNNSMTKNWHRIQVKNTNMVGGLVGVNTTGASLQKSISLGRLIYSEGMVPIPSNFGAVVGGSGGNIVDNMYLENNLGGLLGYAVSDTCNQSSIDFTTTAPTYLTLAIDDADLLEKSNYYYNAGNSLTNLLISSLTADYTVGYNGNSPCSSGDTFAFYRSYDPSGTGKSIADFSSIANFNAFDIAYESDNSALARNVDRLYDYYKSEMYGTPPKLIPPIWELEEGDSYPRLVQIND